MIAVMTNNAPNKRSAFTLVEISIVLIIIGLIVGGILAGADMIRAAELRATLSDSQSYAAATYTFKNKYGHLPGDLPNATEFWTSCTDNGSNPCDGNGNRNIGQAFENFRFWQHLSLSGIVPESYTGVGSGGDENYMVPGENVPQTAIGGGFRAFYFTFYGSVDHYLWLANDDGAGMLNGFALSPNEVQLLDLKIDDGLADNGRMLGMATGASGATCVTAGYNTSAASYLNNDTISCKMAFRF